MATKTSCLPPKELSAPPPKSTLPRMRPTMRMASLPSTATPSAPFMATGSLGGRQLQRLADLLRDTGRQGLFRVVLLHHPPVPGEEKWRKRLTDAGLIDRMAALERLVEQVAFANIVAPLLLNGYGSLVRRRVAARGIDPHDVDVTAGHPGLDAYDPTPHLRRLAAETGV